MDNEQAERVVLSMDTSTSVCSVALHTLNGLLLAESSLHISKTHAAFLLPMIASLYEFTNTNRAQTAGVALGQGPGSYTGLRIATASAKGLAHALNCPLYLICSLAALADSFYSRQQSWPTNTFFVPMIDARRMEVYASVYDALGQELEKPQAKILDEASYEAYLQQGRVYFLGNGSDKYVELMQSHPQAFFIKECYPDARSVGRLALKKIRQQATPADLAYSKAFYLKNFAAGKPKSLEDYFKKKAD